jgi:peptidyl-prolyl cis-trans isomerase A (cyclophilin A)
MAIYATLVTSLGDIKVELFPDTAPKTVANFVGLATGEKDWTHPRTGERKKESLYAGTIFHRVIPDFMIQGGDPLGQGTGGPGYKFEDEFGDGRSMDGPGYLAMANSGPGTNGSQFFITVAPTAWLTGKHTIFGKVTEGQDVANKISRVATARGDRPLEDVVLKEVQITED